MNKGTLIIITMPDGHVAAADADFDASTPMGYTREEIQTARATERAWNRVMHDYCNPQVAAAICADGATIRGIGHRLEHDHGWRVTARNLDSEEL